MKYLNVKYSALSVGAAWLIVLSFQNCSPASFKQVSQTVSASSAPTILGCNLSNTPVSETNSVKAYLSAQVGYGETCISEERTCVKGVLSGLGYTYPSCEAAKTPSTCQGARPADAVDQKSCTSLGATYMGNFTETTPYVCESTQWIKGLNKTNNSSTVCSRQCASSKPVDSVTSKSCSVLLGSSYSGSYSETTPKICSATSWTWINGSVTTNANTACVAQTCNLAAKPDALQEPRNCSALGATYSGNYIFTTPYICSGTNWIAGTISSDNSASACSRQCALPKLADALATKACADKLGSTYQGTYTETTPYSCSTSTLSWTPSATFDNAYSVCKQALIYSLAVTSPVSRQIGGSGVLHDPTLTSSSSGATNSFSVTIKNTGNTSCTPSNSRIWSQYTGSNVVQVGVDFAISSGLTTPISAGSSQVVNLTAIAKNDFSYVFNLDHGNILGGIEFKCIEDISNNVLTGLGFMNSVNPVVVASVPVLNLCSPLDINQTYTWASDSNLTRVRSGANLNVQVGYSPGKYVAIHKGAQAFISPTGPAGPVGDSVKPTHHLYFERNMSEYSFRTGGNQLYVTDSCGRTVTISQQGDAHFTALYFADGGFTVVAVSAAGWGYKVPSAFILLSPEENLSVGIQSIIANKDTNLNSQNKFVPPF